MKRSSDRILTTHVGSLIRPQPLQAFLRAKQTGGAFDAKAYETCLTQSVGAIVRRQAEAGIDVVSDGEFGKSISWSHYALERLSGFERRQPLTQIHRQPAGFVIVQPVQRTARHQFDNPLGHLEGERIPALHIEIARNRNAKPPREFRGRFIALNSPELAQPLCGRRSRPARVVL